MEDLVDYARPLINAETHLKRIHALCLDKKYADAYEQVMRAIVELRGLEAVLVIMNADERKKDQWKS